MSALTKVKRPAYHIEVIKQHEDAFGRVQLTQLINDEQVEMYRCTFDNVLVGRIHTDLTKAERLFEALCA